MTSALVFDVSNGRQMSPVEFSGDSLRVRAKVVDVALKLMRKNPFLLGTLMLAHVKFPGTTKVHQQRVKRNGHLHILYMNTSSSRRWQCNDVTSTRIQSSRALMGEDVHDSVMCAGSAVQ